MAQVPLQYAVFEVVTVARAHPLGRSDKFELEKRSEDSAIREFGFGSEAPTAPNQDLELLIERTIAESAEFPLGWSLAPEDSEETPTLLRPPAEEDLELCADRRTPILPINTPFQKKRSAIDLVFRDPGPPIPAPTAYSQRPTAPPEARSITAVSQRPTVPARKPQSIHPHDPFTDAFPRSSPLARSNPSYREPERQLPPAEYFGREPVSKPISSSVPREKTSPAPPSSRAPRSASVVPRSNLQPGAIRVLMSEEQIRALPLDHRAGFVLSMVGLVHTVDELLDISGMSRSEAMRLLCDLVDLGAIDLG